MIDKELLDILACPETKEPVHLAEPEMLAALNDRIERGEGDIAAPLGALAEAFPELSIGCYPFQKDGLFGANVVIRGTDSGMLDQAMAQLKAEFPS